MINTLKVKNITIGEGIPKICVPIVGVTREEILRQGKQILSLGADLVEWRVDFFQNVKELDKVLSIAKELRTLLPSLPILFTFRRKEEGGQQAISLEDYFTLNKEAALSGSVDLIDIELFSIEDSVQFQLLEQAIHNAGTKIIMSNHDFEKTISKQTIIQRLCQMESLGCDISKIALMPNKSQDVLTLMDATNEMLEHHATRPVITMSMGKLGMISRLSGETFGSSVTFASAEQASAPGQIPVIQLKEILELLHFIDS